MPKADDEKTIVVFRKWRSNGGIIALFPFDPGTPDPFTCNSFEHLGQHGAASTILTEAHTTLAKPHEYEELKRELESAPYNYRLEIRQRIPRNAIDARRKALGIR